MCVIYDTIFHFSSFNQLGLCLLNFSFLDKLYSILLISVPETFLLSKDEEETFSHCLTSRHNMRRADDGDDELTSCEQKSHNSRKTIFISNFSYYSPSSSASCSRPVESNSSAVKLSPWNFQFLLSHRRPPSSFSRCLLH